MAGLSWDEVAAFKDDRGEPLYSQASAAWRGAKAHMDRTGEGDSLGEHRRLDMERLDALQRAWWRKALQGDAAAAKLVLTVMRERAKLLGLQGLTPHEGNEDPLDELAARRSQKTGTEE
jgi:hypothetical protein